MKSLSTALRVLNQFTEETPWLSVSELTRRSGLTKGQVSKILATFREAGILQQDPQSRFYSVGVKAFELGSRFVNYHPLAREGLPVLRRLMEKTGHSARLTLMTGDSIIYLAQVEGRLLSDSGWRVGMFLPIHATSAGKVTLAFLEPERAEQLIESLDMRQLTPNTITDKKELRRQLQEIVRRGYGTARGESTNGLAAVGVPVFGPDDKILSVVSLSYPQHVVAPDQEPELAAILHEAARVLSHRMGARVYPFGGQRLASTG
jgi:DNA-binding IclR family transcriptional regulator